MKMVSVAKLGKVKERAAKELSYIDTYLDLFLEITSAQKKLPLLPTLTNRPVKRVLLICLTTDRGLCGAFNQHVLKNVVQQYQTYKEEGIAVDILPIGQKGFDFFQKRDIPFLKDYVDITYEQSISQVNHIADFARSSFVQEDYDRVELIYQPSKIAAKEKISLLQLLPIVTLPFSEERGEDAYQYEPSRDQIITDMVPHVVRGQLYKAWLIGTIAEQSARMLVTSQATDNAQKLIKELRLSYNRIRQSAITRSLSEIVAGVDAMH